MSTSADSAMRLWKRNGWVWLALMTLLGLSAVAAYWPLGALTTVIGLAIAVAKAGLVVTLFMRLKQSSALIRLVAACGLFWALIMFALTFADVLSRLANS